MGVRKWENVSEQKAVKDGAKTCKAWVTQRAAAADTACDGPRPEGREHAGKPHRPGPADGFVGDGNVGVDEAVGQLGLTHATVHWLLPRYLLLTHLHRMLCPVTHAHITARDAVTQQTPAPGAVCSHTCSHHSR